MGEEALRLNRMALFPRVMTLISKLAPRKKRAEMRRMAGFVLLERNAAEPAAL
jgi:hypothetical protein